MNSVNKYRRSRIAYCSADYFVDISIPVVNALAKTSDVHFIVSYWGDDEILPCTVMMQELLPEVQCTLIHRKGRRRSPQNFLRDMDMFTAILNAKPDVMFVESVEGPYFLPFYLLLKLSGFRIVLGLHDVVPHSGWGHWIDEVVKRVYIALANDIVVYSVHQRKMLLDVYKRNGTALTLPYKDYYEKLYTDVVPMREKNTLLFFGAIRPNKGLELLIRAAQIVRTAIPDLKIIIAGACDDFGRYAREITIPEMFELHIERIPDEEVGRYFLRSQALVLPYHDATQSGPVVIAYGFGCPVIAANVGSLPEYVQNGETGLIYDSEEPVALTEAIRSLLTNESLLKQMQEHVCEFARDRFNASRIAARLNEVFESVTK